MFKKLVSLAIAAVVTFGFFGVAHAQHKVEKGDTMYKIALRYGMTMQDIINMNPQHPDPNIIHIGDMIIVREGNTATEIIEYARSLQDITVYTYGGQDAPYFTDCSGWVQAIYKKWGIYLPRTSRDQSKIGTPVKFEDLKAGDLMYFSTRADKVITHVGIAMNENFWISNLSTKQDVEILSNWGNWTQKYFLFAKRVI
jgi:hypothetical protein